jgi:hypothetical protein
VAYSTAKVSSHDLHSFDSSFVDDLCDSMLPIEHHPVFVNFSARLKLGKESDSVVSFNDDNDDDDIYASSADGDDQLGQAIFSGF